jgi:hypothetical protein
MAIFTSLWQKKVTAFIMGLGCFADLWLKLKTVTQNPVSVVSLSKHIYQSQYIFISVF